MGVMGVSVLVCLHFTVILQDVQLQFQFPIYGYLVVIYTGLFVALSRILL
jgi:hypothetical protein